MVRIPVAPNGKTDIDDILKGATRGLVYRVDGDPRMEFARELAHHGLVIPNTGLVLNKITRVKDSADKGPNKSGWYIFNLLDDKYREGEQFGVGSYGSWHGNPPTTTWCSKFEERLDDTERQHYLEQISEMRAKQEQEEEQRYLETAQAAGEYLKTLSPKGADKHPYITRKQIKPYGALLSKDGNEVIIPVLSQNGEPSSYQRIMEKGKYFLSGGRTKGGYFVIGQPDDICPIIIAEGYATACSLHEATGYQTYIAFSASNMLNVANLVRSRNPDATILVCADNDQFTINPPNPGKTSGEAAARICEGALILPEFKEGDLESKPTDFNDYHVLYGLKGLTSLVKYNLDAHKLSVKKQEPQKNNKKESGILQYNEAGIITDTVRWICNTSQKPQPELALMNVITALGAVFGRRYRSPSNLRTNIYFVGIAPTGVGKDHSRKCIKRLLIASGMEMFIGSDAVISGGGILTALKKSPSQIMHLDEFGEMLQLISNKNASGYLKQAITNLTQLFTDAASTHDSGDYANDKVRSKVKIVEPNLCVFGTSTIESYAESLRSKSVENGQLNRYLAMKVSNEMPKRLRGVIDDAIPENLAQSWKALKPRNYTVDAYTDIKVCHFTDAAQERYDDLGDEEDKLVGEHNKTQRGAMFNRYREQITKLAMIFCISENHEQPLMEVRHLSTAQSMVDACLSFTMHLMNEYMYDSEFEKLMKRTLRMITRDGMPRSTLMRNLSLKAKDLDEVITALVQRGDVEARAGESVKSGVQPIVYYLVR